jgi:hypothetical protein
MVDEVAMGQIFLPILLFFPVSIIAPCSIIIHSSTDCSYQKDKRAKLGNTPKSNALLEIE